MCNTCHDVTIKICLRFWLIQKIYKFGCFSYQKKKYKWTALSCLVIFASVTTFCNKKIKNKIRTDSHIQNNVNTESVFYRRESLFLFDTADTPFILHSQNSMSCTKKAKLQKLFQKLCRTQRIKWRQPWNVSNINTIHTSGVKVIKKKLNLKLSA